ncbi:MAG: RadC family protein [Oscillospiraceae bacterium]|nr:RadC family protein [Oscillospiraceae bacterium]
MSVHDGHRERMRKRIAKESIESFAPHEVLEVLLYSCMSRGDTNAIAHRLIKKYKTIARILEANPEDLETVEGVGPRMAEFLTTLNQIIRYICVERDTEILKEPILDREAYSDLARDLFFGMTNEASYMICLNPNMTMIDKFLVGKGDVVSTQINIRKLAEIALQVNAAAVILAHNHPNGLVIPSKEDIYVTEKVKQALDNLNIQLVDHLIVSGSDVLSLMSAAHKYRKYFRQEIQEIDYD